MALNVTVRSIVARRRPYEAAEAETAKLAMMVMVMVVVVMELGELYAG